MMGACSSQLQPSWGQPSRETHPSILHRRISLCNSACCGYHMPSRETVQRLDRKEAIAVWQWKGFTSLRMCFSDTNPPPRAREPFAAQVEYEPVELAILQSRRESSCSGEIRCVRRVLARRDEAYMRLALSRPSDQARRPPGRRDAPCSWRGRILDDPEVQTHVTPPRLVDAFDSVLQSWRIRVNSIEKTMGILTASQQQPYSGSLDSFLELFFSFLCSRSC